MKLHWQPMIWQQFNAALEMFNRTVRACPDELWAAQVWDDEDGEQGYGQTWGIAAHTLVWLDLYLTGRFDGFEPQPPFKRGQLPAVPYTRDEILTYLAYCRQKCRATIDGLTGETATRPFHFKWGGEMPYAELLLYTMRHTQEHMAHLNLVIGQNGHAAPQDAIDYVNTRGGEAMNIPWQPMIWRQYGAALDVLGDAIAACPDELWRARMYDESAARPEYAEVWYRAYHALFWVDLYLFGAEEEFRPPAPFELIEMAEDDLPAAVYTKEQLLSYWAYCRRHCRETLLALSDEAANRLCTFAWGQVTFAELQLYSLRHVQEHAAQLGLFLGQNGVAAPDWVSQARPAAGDGG